MIKISAFNAESEESGSEEEFSKQALEQIAFQEYARALDLQRKGNISEAIQLLKDLLDTELLYDVQKPKSLDEKKVPPLFNLKYLCYKNLGSMLHTAGELDAAIETYNAASELDDTDITLWHRLGVVSMQARNYEMALHAFQRGVEKNSRHWPCLDKMIILLLGLGYKEHCITIIHEALLLDPGYMRGLVYRRHIYTVYRHMKQYMVHINPIYTWNEADDEPIDEEIAEKLLKEAEEVQEISVQQQKDEVFIYTVQKLKLEKPISKTTWKSVGESLIHMHKYITENGFSHACHIEILFKEEEEIEVCKESETVSAKASVRRRGFAVASLQTWEWCTRRKSGRKKPDKETIYDILHKMVPLSLVPEAAQNKEQVEETSPEAVNLVNLNDETEVYFGTDSEKDDVKLFIDKHTNETKDIIDLLNYYLCVLSSKYKLKWPEGLPNVYLEANNCYKNHIDIPACTDDNHNNLLQYVSINLLAQEFMVNEKINLASGREDTHELNVVESIDVIISQKPTIFSGSECLESILRTLWLKVHIHYVNKYDEFMLDCLYLLLEEFHAMGEHHDTYSLTISNFTFRPLIQESEILKSISSLERNIKLSVVMNLFRQGNYEEVVSIITEFFEQCKMVARKRDEKLALDFAVQVHIMIDSYWALNKVDCCLKWAFRCLHESLKIYFIAQSIAKESVKWSRTIKKILCGIEHILENEGISVLDMMSHKELSQGIDDLIRIMSHQIEANLSVIPFHTISPWIILHYILQREEDQERRISMKTKRNSKDDSVTNDEEPNSVKLLFMAHEELGEKSWCCYSEGKLLYFTLDSVVSRLCTPAFEKFSEQIKWRLEQCVFCLYGHPAKKPKMKASDHKASGTHTLDWDRAQQIYEIFRPTAMPVLTGTSAISNDTEVLFQRILSLLPDEYDLSKYVLEAEKYINGQEEKLPVVSTLLPYKMRDIYMYLGDFHFKKTDYTLAIKYNILDVVINNHRFLSWAQIALSKAKILDIALDDFKKETEFLDTAKATIRCFKRSVELNPNVSYLWLEYGTFVYRVHSLCSRLLKQASESLSMEEFEALEKQKEDFLDITSNCLAVVNSCSDSHQSDNWLLYYTLGKVAEKRNNPPSVYLTFYMQGVKSLIEAGATYPTKISCNTSSYLCLEVLELHYRIHASILKYIEQHENKPIPASVGKVFITCLEEWKQGPFARKNKKYNDIGIESETKSETQSIQAGNILKRSVSDAGEEDTHEAKRLKLEAAAAKVRRSASYDTECSDHKDSTLPTAVDTKDAKEDDNIASGRKSNGPSPSPPKERESKTLECPEEKQDKALSENTDVNNDKQDESLSSSSSSSSSNSNSSESSSDSSSNSNANSDNSSKSSQDSKPITEEEINKIVSACLDGLEDCASRYSLHYKALYRLAHYHFYSQKGKNIERSRDLMLSTFYSRSGKKMSGLFSEKKSNNLFNNIWRFSYSDVEKPGSFPSHMNRSVLLTLEILKEIDDHKTLHELSLHLQKIPERGKTYLRDSDREDLAQQAFSLSVQSLKGQVYRFSQQADLKTNEVERRALKSLMLDIYKVYKAQMQPNSKQIVNLLVDAYKLILTTPVTENMNLVDLALKYSQSLKPQATGASMDKAQNFPKKQSLKSIDTPKTSGIAPNQTKADPKPQNASSSVIPKVSSSQKMSYPEYLPMLNDPLLSQQTAAALSYIGNMSALAGYASLQNSLQSTFQTSFQNSFQAEIYRQFLEQNFSPYSMMNQKKKRGPKPMRRSLSSGSSQNKQKPYSVSTPPMSKAAPTSVITSLQKSTSAQLAPCMGTVLSSLPPSMTASLSSFGATSTHSSSHSFIPQAHSSSSSISVHSKPTTCHKVSPSKTLQEKLAEKHKSLPSSQIPPEINASISRLPSSLTITKTSSSKQPLVQGKMPKMKNDTRPKPISSDEVIVLDDD